MPAITPIGSEFLVNQITAGGQYQVANAAAGNGFLSVWSSPLGSGSSSTVIYANSDIRGRLFNADGSAAGNEFTINTTTAGAQYRPQVAQLTDGHLLVVWQSGVIAGNPPTTATLRAQELTADGPAVGGEFTITGPGAVQHPNVAALAGGGWAALWRTGNQIGIQRYDSANAAVGAPITISGANPGERIELVQLTGGDLVVGWTDSNGGRAQIYTASGTPVGAQIAIPANLPIAPRVTALSDGGFVLTAFAVLNSQNIVGYSIHAADGTQVAEGAIDAGGFSYDVEAVDGGDFVVAFQGPDAGNANATDIFAQLVRGDGGTATRVLVNTQTAGDQYTPVLARLANGDLAVNWADNAAANGDGDGLGLKGRILDFVAGNGSAPLAVADRLVADFSSIAVADLLANDSDPDGDVLTIIAVGNAIGGSVGFNQDGSIFFQRDPGQMGPLRFNYTVSDGAGLLSAATATILGGVSDVATVRGAGPFTIDVLANDAIDFPNGQTPGLSAFVSGEGSARFDGVDGRQLFYSTITNPFNSPYFNLAVGQTSQATVSYAVYDPQSDNQYSAQLVITLEGWAQLGGTGADTLTGSNFADHLSGGDGAANRLIGLGGDDWYSVSVAGDVVVEAAGGGVDGVRTGLASFTLPDEVENLYLGSGIASLGIGNAADNIIIGTIGNDTLYGMGGNDRISTVSGTDMVYGGTGDDVFIGLQGSLIFENAGEGIDTVIATSGYYLYANIENLTLFEPTFGGVLPDWFGVGNELDNVITGNRGSNLLIGLAGNDTISGGASVDALFGLADDDQLNGDAGVDYLVGGDGHDDLAGGDDADALYGQDGNDTLIGGNSFDTDILVGGDGDDLLDGASRRGDYDLMDGGAGDDQYLIDTPADLTFEAAGGGIDTVYADIDGGGYYLYAFTDNLILLGNTPFGVGNELANQLTGNGIGNYLLGGLGNDTLNGGAGNDVLFGEGGADIFVFEQGGGGDVIGDFQAGTDRIDARYVFGSFAEVQANLSQVGNTSALNLGNGDFIVLNGVAISALTAGDFIFG